MGGEGEGVEQEKGHRGGRSNELGGLFWIKCVSRKNVLNGFTKNVLNGFTSQPSLISAILHVCMAVVCEVSDHWWETDNQWRKSKLPGFFFETAVIYGWGKINVHHLVSSSADLPQEIISNFLVLFQIHNIPKVYWMDRLYQKCIPRTQEPVSRFLCSPRGSGRGLTMHWLWARFLCLLLSIPWRAMPFSRPQYKIWDSGRYLMQIYLHGMWVFWSFFANLKENYFDFSYIRDWQLHIMLQRHQSWVQNESKSKSIWAGLEHGAPFILCLNGSRAKD